MTYLSVFGSFSDWWMEPDTAAEPEVQPAARWSEATHLRKHTTVTRTNKLLYSRRHRAAQLQKTKMVHL